jgi:putative ABC transport system permease protein
MLRRLRHIRAVIGLAAVRLKRNPHRTTLAVLGVALAVLAVTLLASVGAGVIDTGQQKFNNSGRDLWVTGGPLQLQPGGGTPIENSLVGSHRVADSISRRDDVAVVTPIAFQAVYVGKNRSDLKLLTGTGLPRAPGGKAIDVSRGGGLTGGDTHYANGTYDGPMNEEVVIDPRVARTLNVSINDTLYIGGSQATARNHEFTVVGVSSSFSRFLGTPTVIHHLSELQEVTGTTGSDRATYITIRLQPGVNPEAVKSDLQEEYPEFTIRTNREQLEALLRDKSLIIGSAAALVVLAIVAGIGLTVNLLMLVVYQQRRELAALRALGLSRGVPVGIVATEGILIGLGGGALGLGVTPVTVRALNWIAAKIVGFESLLQTPVIIYAGGAIIAVVIGTSN